MAEEFLEVEQEYLTFSLGNESYGVDILCVQEIRVWTPVTEIPNTPNFLKGVINLRGTIVPIVDLRQRFGYGCQEYTNTTVVIVLQGEVRQKKSVVGVVVDAVSDVFKVGAQSIKEAPDFGSHIDSCFIEGMAEQGEDIVILLDSGVLLDVDELFRNAEPLTRRAS